MVVVLFGRQCCLVDIALDCNSGDLGSIPSSLIVPEQKLCVAQALLTLTSALEPYISLPGLRTQSQGHIKFATIAVSLLPRLLKDPLSVSFPLLVEMGILIFFFFLAHHGKVL